MRERYFAKNGFTLLELIIVMAIIAILTAVGIFALNNARLNGRDAKRKADLEQVRSALELYKSDCNSYPASITFGSALTSSCPGSSVTYSPKLPTDSTSGRQYSYNPVGTPPTTYTLCSSLEGISAGVPSGCTASCGTACNYAVTNP